jgi:hypothetical protein
MRTLGIEKVSMCFVLQVLDGFKPSTTAITPEGDGANARGYGRFLQWTTMGTVSTAAGFIEVSVTIRRGHVGHAEN